MFTLGIFTTHLPYIALVVFYAFFWAFGVNKASAGELQSGERVISIEIPFTETVSEKYFSPSDVQNCPDIGYLSPGNKDHFTALRKLLNISFYRSEYPSCSCYAAVFSRPPPFAF